ncbi:uracil-DNA glycosylase family protein [Streptococcus sp. NSJ-72]|mgnify:FL=1|uniref:uracil-DNA glycosylase family protein n=1 Tax=Streptococcus TaxID=1301 RepID=UPI000660C3DF|nr:MULTISPECIES: uracil-DNA glycosylase family protein [Streptococcus]OFP94916.1 uracil-DNA glycosylase [Streptococcus sp. HMSC067A03]QNL42005.1 uracil-DNA glycosylase family protein [Streptococcus sp. NSJ-72]
METLEDIKKAIMVDPQNQVYTERGIEPLFAAPKSARINIVGQAPGIKAQETRLYWNDKSGDRLREWMGVDYDTFYHSGYFAAIPMDFYFPGHGKSGDLPPRKGFAEKWHQQILELLPDLELTILIGQYAQKYYLHQKGTVKLTDTVKHYQDYLPEYFPLVHPSPRNQIWLAKNPWFAEQVIPDLRANVQQIISR